MEVGRVKQRPFGRLVSLQNKFKEQSGKDLSRWIIKSLIKKYGFQKVISYLENLDVRNKRNPVGYLTAAIKNNWPIEPKYLKQYEIEKRKELVEAKKFRESRSQELKYSREYQENLRKQELRKQLEKLSNGL